MKAPDFWERRPATAAALLLSPLGALYGAAARRRLLHNGQAARIPVVAIGGVTLGGDGKTPLAQLVAALLREMGARPFFLSRGYGRSTAGETPFHVDPARHDADTSGDEALLLARCADTIVGADRIAAARLAEDLGATALVLDDGFHSRRLRPDLALLVVDADYGAGNGLCPPAGPLRAPLAAQLAAADALIIIGDGAAGAPVAAQAAALGKPALSARIVLSPAVAARLAGLDVFAFAGIGRPQKFLRTLEEAGARVRGRRWFCDHHIYAASEVDALRAAAALRDARLVTTEKDAARLPGAADILAVPVALRLSEDAAARLRALLAKL